MPALEGHLVETVADLAAGAWPLVVRASRLEPVRFHPAKVLAGCPIT
jgi:hypothetical protein